MENYIAKNINEYNDLYNKSISNPENFWSEIASTFSWRNKWTKTLEYDFNKPEFKWFLNGKLNITENCLDRHLQSNPNKTAILFEPNDPNEAAQKISYKELHRRVCIFANVLKNKSIKKGDRVCIYMPMVPELTVAVLACARIGAVHSVVFAGFSATALAARINDSECKILLTADGSFRGSKVIDLKSIVDKALIDCSSIKSTIVLKRIGSKIKMNINESWWHEEIKNVSDYCIAEEMDSEDMLFILYTSGSTGKPKGMVHSCGGYMVYSSYTFLNVFQYNSNDIYWCTADIGWITGHSYIVYGPLLSGATSVMFEGVPSYPDFSRFWNIVEKHKITHFYTAPTAIRALAKHPISLVENNNLSSLKVLGTVGEPINEEAWNWYDKNVGKSQCPIVDTWWQTETGGIMLSSLAGVTNDKPTFATKPMIGIQPILLDKDGKEIIGYGKEGILAIKYPWPSIARTIYGNHERYKNVYFTAYPGYYFPGDGALTDNEGNFRITGRVDDVVIVSGHNLGTAPIEDAINLHKNVVESAVVGYPHEIKGNALRAFVILLNDDSNLDMAKEIKELISKTIGPIAKPDIIQVVPGLPKTRSGKIMRRILRKIASGEKENFGDISTLLNPEIVDKIVKSS
ncbi:acetate--CoA ligase [Flavobacteriaceae bacterium]|nr:acetate--CoA ligase [Flavobacteriaceae bacterium]MBT4232231.1 acetate--CoA ligase [Flavobacteriaceae bacterium]MBT5393171.1 acetate--CoA ligase [Flavobacteriaceae bacterium]MBT7574404.1 acetate--CoA ligase [Flavobacteriaceae bacterium]MBT7984484.1 acetate--CoA ligase [Flavobacteriaceae bacterium]